MFRTKILLFFLLLGLPSLVTSQNTLTVWVEGVSSSDGYIAVAVYSDEDGFLKDGKAFTGAFAQAEKGTTHIEFHNLPDGIYAVSIFHDENGNKEMDTNLIGIPKEPLGFSIGKLKTFGPPSFKECSFEMTSDFEIKIPIK